jgi:Asp-tRNA(Asn)/Glu-tRNA(Gln) amidotransferase A subunit family amidase
VDPEALCWLSAVELSALYRRRRLSPVEVVDAVLARIEKVNPRLNAYVLVTGDRARRQARAAERALGRRARRLGPLHGVPYSLKDVVLTRGLPTTFGTPLLRDNVPAEDAPVEERLQAAGGILVGKTNTPTFGWIAATHNLLFGATRNPWQLDRTPGGSSGGASAAVAAGLAPLAVGTDGGGSIRIPAAFTGIVGFKPSFGRIPMYPPPGYAWSLSNLGPLTRTVADAALMMDVMAGPDERDPCSLPADGARYLAAARSPSVRGLRLAYADDLGFNEALDPEVAAVCGQAVRAFREAGGRVERIEPGWPSPKDCWEQIFLGGLAVRLQPFLDRKDEIDPGLRPVLEAMLRNPPTRYVQAWFDRLTWWRHPQRLFETYDLLLTPTVACAPFAIGLDNAPEIAGRPVTPYGWMPFTFPFNLTGQPAASVPAGFTRQGLPVGLQIVGRRFDDVTVIRAAAAFERERPWRQHRPPLAG